MTVVSKSTDEQAANLAISQIALVFLLIFFTYTWFRDLFLLAVINLASFIFLSGVILLLPRYRWKLLKGWLAVVLLCFIPLSLITYGWDTHIHYYYFAYLPIGVYYTRSHSRGTIFSVVLGTIILGVVAFYLGNHPPLFHGDPSIIKEFGVINTVGSILASIFLASILQIKAEKKLQHLLKQMHRYRQLSDHDSLTGALSRHRMEEDLQHLSDKFTRGQLLSLVISIFDLDDFKKINDTYGHPMGDKVLAQIGAYVRQMIRQEDYFARWGGEEFLICLPAVSLPTAVERMEAIAAGIKAIPIHVPGKVVHVSATFGLVTTTVNEDIHSAVAQADQALYCGKGQKKGGVYVYGEEGRRQIS